MRNGAQGVCLLLPETPQQMQRAAELIDRALAADQSRYPAWATPFFLFAKGLAEYRRNSLRSAIAILEGDASRVMGPAPRIVLAMARYRSGEREAARWTLASAVIDHDWRAASADLREIWIYHVLRREAEAMLFPNLPAFLEGTYQPADQCERLAFVGAAEFNGLTCASPDSSLTPSPPIHRWRMTLNAAPGITRRAWRHRQVAGAARTRRTSTTKSEPACAIRLAVAAGRGGCVGQEAGFRSCREGIGGERVEAVADRPRPGRAPRARFPGQSFPSPKVGRAAKCGRRSTPRSSAPGVRNNPAMSICAG